MPQKIPKQLTRQAKAHLTVNHLIVVHQNHLVEIMEVRQSQLNHLVEIVVVALEKVQQLNLHTVLLIVIIV